MTIKEFLRKNGTSIQYTTNNQGKQHIDWKTEWHIAEERVQRFFNWLRGDSL